jgi:hypothetical protein
VRRGRARLWGLVVSDGGKGMVGRMKVGADSLSSALIPVSSSLSMGICVRCLAREAIIPKAIFYIINVLDRDN